jgi:hypothetical protein
MKKINYIIIILLVYLQVVSLQAQELVSAAGNYFINAQGSISWSLGETVIETYTSGEMTLTQGFKQPNITISTIAEDSGLEFEITVFPNPTQAHIIIFNHLGQAEKSEFRLYDTSGRLILGNKLDGTHTQIAMDNYPAGNYIINVISEGKRLKVFKIIKQ